MKREFVIALVAVSIALNARCAAAATSDQPPSTQPAFMCALIGDRMDRLTAEREAGVTAHVVRISWRDLLPDERGADQRCVEAKRREFDDLHAAGLAVIVDLGLQNAPSWIHQNYTDTSYVNQFNESYDPGEVDCGDANLVFNPQVRGLAQRYIDRLFEELATRIDYVRIGGGHWGELSYPSNRYHGHDNCYWAFDRNAQKADPAPGWRPGDASPHGEAEAFANWYVQQLAEYQNWQIHAVRHHFAGPIMVLYPSWGIRPGQLEAAIQNNLSGGTSPEINGEIQRGYDFARQIRGLDDANLIVSCTWLDADGSKDVGSDAAQWSPVHYLAGLVHTEHPALRLFGENTGQGSPQKLEFTVAQARRFGLCGFAWFSQGELGQPGLATLADYRKTISAHNPWRGTDTRGE